MAERILSPGVFSRENDLSFLTPAAPEISTAVVGPTAKGPVEIPTVVRSYGEYLNVFGGAFKSGSDYYGHLTALAAEKYFEQGGGSLLVTRVKNGTFATASATVHSGSTALFSLGTLASGEIMNNSGSSTPYTGSNGSLVDGTADNVRWEITSVNAEQGTFSLIVRRGDDTTKNKIVLESYTKLSLDPKSDNYIAKVIGDQYEVNQNGTVTTYGDYPNVSKYVRVSSVDVKMPDYFDNAGNAKAAYSSSLGDLAVGSGSYHGAFANGAGTVYRTSTAGKYFEAIDGTDTQGLDTATDYATAITTLTNRDEYRFNVLLTPGLFNEIHSGVVGQFIDMVEDRSDAIYVVDLVKHGKTSTASPLTESGLLNSSFATAYWPWVKVASQSLGKAVWAPASTVMGGVFAFNDRVGAEWFAPAGLLRGGIPGVVSAERKLSQTERDSLYLGKVNPIASFPGAGVVAYGQKTLQTKASALDRVNVRRLLINLKNFIGEQANNLVFEQNTIATRNRFLANVNPYLETVVQRQGLYAYRVVMDDTNNTPDVIDRNQLVGQIYIQPTKTAEFIVLDFVVQPSGATFGA